MADEQLVVLLEAKINQFERDMKKAGVIAGNNFSKIESRAKSMQGRLGGSFAGSAKQVGTLTNAISGLGKALALAGAGVSLAAIERLADTATTIQNSLKATGLAGADLTNVYGSLFQSAQRNAMTMETLIQLYQRASMAAKDLGADQDDLLKFTDKVKAICRWWIPPRSACTSTPPTPKRGALRRMPPPGTQLTPDAWGAREAG
jgi:hypothetical protein